CRYGGSYGREERRIYCNAPSPTVVGAVSFSPARRGGRCQCLLILGKEGLSMSSDRDRGDYPSPGYAWYVVAVLAIAYIFSFIDRQVLTLLVKPIQADLEITDTQMSLLMGLSFAVFYTLFGIPLGRLADTR